MRYYKSELLNETVVLTNDREYYNGPLVRYRKSELNFLQKIPENDRLRVHIVKKVFDWIEDSPHGKIKYESQLIK